MHYIFEICNILLYFFATPCQEIFLIRIHNILNSNSYSNILYKICHIHKKSGLSDYIMKSLHKIYIYTYMYTCTYTIINTYLL